MVQAKKVVKKVTKKPVKSTTEKVVKFNHNKKDFFPSIGISREELDDFINSWGGPLDAELSPSKVAEFLFIVSGKSDRGRLMLAALCTMQLFGDEMDGVE